MRVTIVRAADGRAPVSVPVLAFVIGMAGAALGTGACAWFIAGLGTMRSVMPLLSMGSGMVAVFLWVLGANGFRPARSASLTVGALAVFLAIESLRRSL